ncbi:MAG: FtsX-like permease family protein, partial [Gemmatimonadetes bacterium]|nr:FtsX-like permease family protein [Gemmatimonadota bacterium]
KNVADQLFSRTYPLGRQIKIDGVPFEVIGVFTPPPDIFGAGSEPQVVIPHGSFTKYIRRAGRWMDMIVSPQAEVTLASAIDDVTATLRSMRRLRPGEENNFTVVTQDAFLSAFDDIAGTFFLVMIALSSVGLLVGGVGVVAIMMISVTERTREIGVRKALGARRREILWQFLVEAVTLTAIGGIIGMAAGGLITFIVARVTPLPAAVPVWSVVAALLASVLTGVGFGMYPATRAAKLDPVEALRYE